jgi:hypothetical protein
MQIWAMLLNEVYEETFNTKERWKTSYLT